MKKTTEKSWIGWVIGIWAIVMAGYWFWFFGSDRRLTFLYGHLHSTPYDAETLSRYLMTGLVMSGVIFVLYTAMNLVMKAAVRRKKRDSKLPDWWQIWKWSSISLALPLLVMLAGWGRPPLGVVMAIGTVAVLKAGLGLALYMGTKIAENWRMGVKMMLDGIGIAPVLILMPLGIAFGMRKESIQTMILIPAIAIGLGMIWLVIMTLIQKRARRKKGAEIVAAKDVLLSGLTWAYLIGPLVHYLISRPAVHLYISSAGNFAANSWWLEILTLAIVFGMVGVMGAWRKKVRGRELGIIALGLLGVTAVGYGAIWLKADKNRNIWVCENDQWVAEGEPDYEKPFAEECGVIDKIIMGE